MSPPQARHTLRVRARSPDGKTRRHSLRFDGLRSDALRWFYRVRDRRQWGWNDERRARMERECRELLDRLGLREGALRELAAAAVIQVEMSYVDESDGWWNRIFPWEYVLSAAIRKWKADNRPVIVRHLAVESAKRAAMASPSTCLMVQSRPGALREHYSFDGEERLLARAFGEGLRRLDSPTTAGLREAIETHRPDVVHLTGVDTHEAWELLGDDPASPGAAFDGCVVADDAGDPVWVPSEVIAPIVANGVGLVACNFYNSAARTCALAVAGGARGAVGFQDTFDDGLAEIFFTSLYAAWLRGDHLLDAFSEAFNVARSHGTSLVGSGIVLWSAVSLVSSGTRRGRRSADDERHEADTAATLTVSEEPRRNLNYAMLHNHPALFEKFTLHSNTRLQAVKVDVSLRVGREDYTYSGTHDVTEGFASIGREISVPLTWWQEGERLRESVRTSLRVSVQHPQVAASRYERTHQVTLLPLNEWSYARENHQWLPSFVLPRDPVVAEVIRRAHRYLCPLFDDPDAGFAGYQHIDPELADPTAPVDWQVQAIWTSLLTDTALDYINPPPSFVVESQRLRTPSAVVEGGRGTCIDLALLLAACLEYVEIYPVVFLLQDHAFPGYWRHFEDHQAFADRALASLARSETDDEQAAGTAPQAQREWVYDEKYFRAVVECVHEGLLVPLETVGLTARHGFWRAVEDGWENLRFRRDFYSMIDVPRARKREVTPLPVGKALS